MLEIITIVVLTCPPGCEAIDQEAPVVSCACINVLNDLGDEETNWRDIEVLALMIEVGSPDADVNCDGDVNADDLGDAITAYFLECVS